MPHIEFIKALNIALDAAIVSGAPAQQFAKRLGTLSELHTGPEDAKPARAAKRQTLGSPNGFKVLEHLDPAIEITAQYAQPWANLARAIGAARDHLQWYCRPHPELPGFMANHGNVILLGPGGLAPHAQFTVGATLMAPDTTYPDHHHPPEELYLVLSDGQWRQNQQPWHTPGIGGTVYNPPNITHAMRSGATPLLAVWCLTA